MWVPRYNTALSPKGSLGSLWYDSGVCESSNEGVGFLSILVSVGDEIVALGIEGWIGGNQVDAFVAEFSYLFKIVASHERAVFVHRCFLFWYVSNSYVIDFSGLLKGELCENYRPGIVPTPGMIVRLRLLITPISSFS